MFNTQNLSQLEAMFEAAKSRPEVNDIEMLAKGRVILPGSSSITHGDCCGTSH